MAAFIAERSALLSLAVSVGQSISPVIDDAKIGMPYPRGRCIRVSFAGEADPPHVAPTTSIDGSELKGRRYLVSFYFPVSDFDEDAAAAREIEMEAAIAALRTALDADRTLGGIASSSQMDDAEVDTQNFGGTDYIYADCPIVVGHTEYGP